MRNPWAKLLNNCLLFVSMAVVGCCSNGGSSESQGKNDTIVMNDYNVIIAPDLSNRINPALYPKPVHDTVLIDSLIDQSIHFLDIKNRHTNQLDVYKFDFINNGVLNAHLVDGDALKIDLRYFKNKGVETRDYIVNRMPRDIDSFKYNVSKIYDYELTHSSGADLWNYFNETVNDAAIDVPDEEIPNDLGKKIIKRNQNVVILFTDGYIECANHTKGYILDDKMINSIRTAFLASSSKDLKEFIDKHPEFQLNKTTNDLHRFNIMVNELVDRSKNENGVALKQPTDFQIMKIVLEKWLRDSGAAHVEVHEAVNSKDLFIKRVSSFLESL